MLDFHEKFISELDVAQNYDLVKLCLFQVFSVQRKFELEYDCKN